MSAGAPLLEDGVLDPPTWGATFDCYMRALRPVTGAPTTPPPDWAKYPEGDKSTRTGKNAGRPQGQHPFVVLGPNGPGNAPITIAQYGGGDQNLAFTVFQEVNPQYHVGVDPEFAGQALNVPDDWADNLAAAPLGGYTVQRDPLPPPPAPAEPGPLALAAPGPRAVGCGAHHLTAPFVVAEHRRATTRRAEVVFLDSGATPVVECGPGSGPCRSGNCELYDPRAFDIAWVNAPDDLDAFVEISLRAGGTGEPIGGVRYEVLSRDGKKIVGRLDENGYARVAGVRSGTCQISFPDIAAGDWR